METLFFLFIWLICGIVSAIIAGNKNRNPIAWFFLGMLLGIFGIVLVAVLPALPLSNQQPQVMTTQQPQYKCPGCGTIINYKQEFCHRCGRAIQWQIPT